MAKAPLVGLVKTRLVPPLTDEEAASLSSCFLRDTANHIAGIGARIGADGVVVYAPPKAAAAFHDLLPKDFQLLAQRGESLGDRLCNATEDLLRSGYDAVCLVNSDSPTLPQAVYEAAIQSLSRAGDRVVLGAADDGGYYLIGLKRVHSSLFDRIAWSTADVLAHTVERAAEIGLQVEVLPRWYDVDDAETLGRLCEELFAPQRHDGAYAARHTRDFLAALIEAEGTQRICPRLSERMSA